MRKNHNHWLSTKEAASTLGISIRTLQEYRNQGIIPFSQIGRIIRYRSEDIQEFLMRNYFKPRFWDKEEGGLK
jgi:excisionase family DNA binding protein